MSRGEVAVRHSSTGAHRHGWVVQAAMQMVLFASGPMLVAQDSAATATIQVSAAHSSLLKPEKLRLQMVVRAEGTDAKQAIKQLAQHKERVRKELLELKAEEVSIEFGAPRFTPSATGMSVSFESRQMRRYLRSMDIDAEKLNGLPKIFNVVATLKADWVLPTANVDAIALLPEGLKEQVQQRDLTGINNKADIDAAMQEKLDEMKTLLTEQLGMDSEDGDVPIRVVFVAKSTVSQRQEDLQKALEAAKEQATIIAQASGVSLGALDRIVSGGAAADPGWLSYIEQRNAMLGSEEASQSAMASLPTSDEVTAESPDALRSYTSVTVIYRTQ